MQNSRADDGEGDGFVRVLNFLLDSSRRRTQRTSRILQFEGRLAPLAERRQVSSLTQTVVFAPRRGSSRLLLLDPTRGPTRRPETILLRMFLALMCCCCFREGVGVVEGCEVAEALLPETPRFEKAAASAAARE